MVPKLGILQLKTSFPRPPGDVGHVESWNGIPVVIRVVEEADGDSVVGGTWGEDLVLAFAREAKRLREEEDCVAFVTSCGFLATMHPSLSRHIAFMGTSALQQVTWLQLGFYPGQRNAVGVVTFKASALTAQHFESVGADPQTPVEGMPENEDPTQAIFKAVLASKIPYDHDGMKNEVVAAARKLQSRLPNLQAIVLECTNMPPFAYAVSEATRLPVWDILTLGKWLYEGAVRQEFRSTPN